MVRPRPRPGRGPVGPVGRGPLGPRCIEFEPTHEELAELIERKFDEVMRRLDDMEARLR